MRVLIIFFSFITTVSFAQESEIKIYSGPAPGAAAWNWQEKTSDSNMIRQRLVYNVVQPSLTAFIPAAGTGNGTALIVCPGGGFHFLSINSEGFDVAQWLVKKGVTVFVLKYRLIQTQGSDPVKEFFSSSMSRGERDAQAKEIIQLAIADGRAAISWVRKNAATYHINSDRIGIIGFSAGGTIAASTATNYVADTKPNFVAPIYAYMPSDLQLDPSTDAPPMFLACASDDQLGLQANSIELYERWNKAKKPVEMHLYAKGGHGFGMQVHNIAADGWIERFGDWLKDLGMLKN